MAVEIGALRALLSLDSAAFEKGAKRAQASMNGLQRGLTKAANRMKSVGKRMSRNITAPLVGATGLLVRSSLSTIDAQGKMAQSLGTTTESLQILARAADTAGISQGDLEGALTRMTRRISLAEQGTGPAVDALERLNLAAEDLSDVTADERIKLIQQRIQEFIPAAEQAGVSSQIFGDRVGIAMTRLDAGQINEAERVLKRFGVTVSEVDTDKIEEANDAISAIGLVTTGLGNQLAVALAPTLQAIAERIADLGAWFAALSPRMRRFTGIAVTVAAAIGPLAIALGFVAAGLAAMASPIGLVILGLGAVAGAAAYVAANWDSLKDRFPILQKMADIGKSLSEAWADLPAIKWALLIPALRWARFIPGIRWAAYIPKISWVVLAGTLKWGALISKISWAALRVIPVIGWVALAGQLAWSALVSRIEWSGWIPRVVWRDWIPTIDWSNFIPNVDWGAIFNSGGRLQEKGREQGEQFGSGLSGGLMSTLPATKGEVRGYLKSLEGAARDESETRSPSRVFMRIGRDLMDGLGVGIADRAQAAAQASADAAAQVAASVEDMDNGMDRVGGSFDQAADRFGDMVAGIITGSQSIADALKNIGNQLISSGISGLASSLFGSTGLGDMFAGLFDGGGTIPGGKFGVVGERGPEIVSGPARVTSRADTAKMMGGGGQPMHITVQVDGASGDDHIVSLVQQGVRAGLGEYDRALPDRVRQVNNDPRGRR